MKGWLGRTAAVVAFAALMAGCAASQAGRSSDLAAILDHVRGHPEDRLAMEVACDSAVAQRSGDFPYKALFAGLLDVPRPAGGLAFCAALIEVVIADDLSQPEQDMLRRPKEVRGMAPMGSLMRRLLVAHERIYATQAQKPPQAQSCGCGQ